MIDIRNLAIDGGIYDCLCDPYDKFKTGDPYGSVMWDLERFASKVAAEVIGKAERYGLGCDAVEQLKEDFGVDE